MIGYRQFISEGWKHCPRCGGKTQHIHHSIDSEGNRIDKYECMMCHEKRDAKRQRKSPEKLAKLAAREALLQRLLKDDET